MKNIFSHFKFRIDQKQIPLLATAIVLIILFTFASLRYNNFCSLRNITNLFYDNSFLGIAAIGMTFVILTGGIDLSVGSMIGFTTIFVAAMVEQQHLPPILAWVMALGLGSIFGCFMGLIIEKFKLPPFLVTLGGLFFARGMAFVVYSESVGIQHPLYAKLINSFSIALPGKTSLAFVAIIFLLVFLVAIYILKYTKFGRNVYAVGANPNSAMLMGLPVSSTIVKVYTISGFCSALAGIVMTLYKSSGDPNSAVGLELDVIAAVVIGGTLLSGGVGYIYGTILGVLILGTIKSALLFDGRLNSWWIKIAIGALLLMFILLQRLIAVKATKK